MADTPYVPTLFISYAHTDQSYRDELKQYLAPLVRANRLKIWDDTQIPPGAIWFDEIKTHLEVADMGVLLVSSAFLASEFINNHELSQLLAKKHRIWLLVSSCAWHFTELKDIQAVYDPSKPLSTLSKAKRAEAWVEIVDRIMAAIKSTSNSPTNSNNTNTVAPMLHINSGMININSGVDNTIVSVKEVRDLLMRLQLADLRFIILDVGASGYVASNISQAEMVAGLIEWANKKTGKLAELKRLAENYS